ncbi:hypothetical protein AcV5_008413 [Taiwanofungus camphoratus]|nr:hypothetical protein AcV5_008413 [Antrodia cinnamomea]
MKTSVVQSSLLPGESWVATLSELPLVSMSSAWISFQGKNGQCRHSRTPGGILSPFRFNNIPSLTGL